MKQPLAFRGLVGLLSAAQSLGAVPRRLDPDTLEAAARKQTGLSDFGDPGYRRGLQVLCDSLNTESGLNAYGVVLARDLMVNFLANRLALQEMRNRDAPELRTPLQAPIIVTGLARTGTTALHRMLAAAPGHRGVEWWELMSPVPFGKRASVAARVKFAKGLLLPRKIFTPHLDAVHFIRENTLEECLWMMGLTFEARTLIEVLPVPAYVEYFLTEADRDAKYRDYADLLRIMQAREPGNRLVMKSPEHMDGLPALLRQIPDAMVVMTHRDPVEAIPSYVSLSDLVHSLGVRERRIDRLAGLWLETGARSMQIHLNDRPSLPTRIYDHKYKDMLIDPLGSVERVFRHFGLDWDTATAETVARHTRENQQHKYGKHRYQISDFGLSADQVRARFAQYPAPYYT